VGLRLAIVIGLAYSSWIAEPLLRRSDPRHGYISELGSQGQPHHLLFDRLDTATGLLALLLAWHLWRSSDVPRGAAAAVALFGLGLAVGGLFPMDCAPSLSAACARAENGDRISWREQVHTVASVAECTGVIAAMALLSWPYRRSWPYRAWLLATPLVSGLALWVAIGSLEHHLVGWTERALACSFAFWLLTIGVVGAPPRVGSVVPGRARR
jgi:hypothetical protein